MENGLFNNILKVDNYVIKVSKSDSNISDQVMNEMNYGTPEEYETRINNIGIKTAKIILSYKFPEYRMIIQEYIDGKTIQELLEEKDTDINIKMDVFQKFLDLYKLAEKDYNLCLDWNMKNFVLNDTDNDIYYVDFTPCLYKSKIMQSTSNNLYQYIESYLNKDIQLAGIFGYAVMSFAKYNTNEQLKVIFYKIADILEKKLDFDLISCVQNSNHVYCYKILQIEKYINGEITYEQMLDNINSYSMENISKEEIINKKYRKKKNNGDL